MAALQEQYDQWNLRAQIAKAKSDAVVASVPKISATVTQSTATTAGDIPTALGGVFIQLAATEVAEDIAEIVKAYATRPDAASMSALRIITDLAVLDEIGLASVISAQISELQIQVTAWLPSETTGATIGHQDGQEHAEFLPGVGAAASLGGDVLTLATQLIAGSYALGGATVDPNSVAGLDFQLGHALRARGLSAVVEIDRLTAVTPGSVSAALECLVSSASTTLVAELRECRVTLAKATTDADDASAAVARIDDEIKAKESEQLEAQRVTAVHAHGRKSAAQATAQARVDEGEALVAAVSALVQTLTTPPANGGRPPVLVAEHGTTLANLDTITLYAKVVAAGVDHELQTKLLNNKWSALAGASVEYALFGGDGLAITAGVRNALRSATGDLKHGLQDIQWRRIPDPPSVGPQVPTHPPFSPSGATQRE